jgi:hypothetical protein
VRHDLKLNGLNTLSPVQANPMPSSVILDYSGGKGVHTLKTLSGLLPGVTVQSLKKPANQTADIVVVLGRDFVQFTNTNNNVEDRFMVGGIVTPGSLNIPRPSPTPTPPVYDSMLDEN